MTLWTAKMDTYITENRGDQSAEFMARFLSTTRKKVTRCAVIGRSRRLGLPKLTRSPTGRPKKEREYKPSKTRTAPITIEPQPMPVAPLNIPFVDLAPHHCREIVGSEGYGMSLSCGHPVIHETSWCRWHHSINTMRAAPRKVQPLAA